jgi:hypothetical protein
MEWKGIRTAAHVAFHAWGIMTLGFGGEGEEAEGDYGEGHDGGFVDPHGNDCLIVGRLLETV